MAINKDILDKFTESASTPLRERIDTLFLDPSIEENYVAGVAERIQNSVASVASLDLEVEIYDLILQVVVESINDNLDNELQDIIQSDQTAGTYLLWGTDPNPEEDPELPGEEENGQGIGVPGTVVTSGTYTPFNQGLPVPEVESGKLKVPYQINYSYLDHESRSKSNGVDPDNDPAPLSPSIRDTDDPVVVEYNGDSRTMPGLRLDPVVEFFDSGIEIFYYQPYKEVSYGTGGNGNYNIKEKKVVVYNYTTAGLTDLISDAKVLFYIFELLRNDSSQTIGAYTKTVHLYQSITRLDIQKGNFLYKLALLQELVDNEL